MKVTHNSVAVDDRRPPAKVLQLATWSQKEPTAPHREMIIFRVSLPQKKKTDSRSTEQKDDGKKHVVDWCFDSGAAAAEASSIRPEDGGQEPKDSL